MKSLSYLVSGIAGLENWKLKRMQTDNSDMLRSSATQPQQGPKLEISTSRQFASWLNEVGASIAFSTYQTGKVFLIGLKPDGSLQLFNRSINRCMGMARAGSSLYVAGLTEIIRFENAMQSGDIGSNGEDALFVPQMSWYTADLDVHDLVMSDQGLVFVNTLFG